MCGIFGCLNGNINKTADVRLTELLIKKQKHRGPDNSGSFSDGNFAVSHVRLSIIDLSDNGKQPMQNAAKDICIAFNGEIYNFRELKKRYALESKFDFRSRTDTEVILYLYELLGIDFLNELNGMFAIAIWDSRIRQLILARDRFGIKPLFYSITDDTIWFSSEIKSILGVPGFEKRICFESIHHYFSFDYIPGEGTAFENIKEIKPGHVMQISSNRSLEIKYRQYWKATYGNERPENIEETVAYIRELIVNAVKSQLVSDVPVGVMLSGGMDSACLTAAMANISGNSGFHTFSLGFDEPSFDESKYSRIVAEKFGTTHHHIKITPQYIGDHIEKYLSFIDEPYADGSAIPTYLLSEEAKKYVKVLLSGEGGDEVFGGYDTYKAYLYNRCYKKLPQVIKWLAGQCVEILPASYKKLSFDYKAKKFVRGSDYNTPQSHYLWREVFSEEEKKKLFNWPVDFEQEYGASSGLFVNFYNQVSGGDELNKLLAIDCSFHFPDDLMIKNDRMTMAHSVEARVPYTDTKLFDYMSRFSGSSKLMKNTTKYFMKKAMKDDLPDSIINKKKIGLEIPYSKWFCQELKEILLDYLSPDSLKRIPFIHAAYVQQLIDAHLTHRKDNGRELWGILNFIAWHKLYF